MMQWSRRNINMTTKKKKKKYFVKDDKSVDTLPFPQRITHLWYEHDWESKESNQDLSSS